MQYHYNVIFSVGHGKTTIQEGESMEPNWDYYGLGTQFGAGAANVLRVLCNTLPEYPIVCEVGSWVGTSSCVMAGVIRGKGGLVYCVDKFHSRGEDNPYLWDAMKKSVPGDSVFDRFLYNVSASGFTNMIHPLVMTSEDAARVMENQLFDFVFLDGDHRYQYISQDIALWLPKVKPGGVIGGHDYEYRMRDIPKQFWDTYKFDHVNTVTGGVDCMESGYLPMIRGFHPGVIRAVDEIFDKRVNHKSAVWWVEVDG